MKFVKILLLLSFLGLGSQKAGKSKSHLGFKHRARQFVEAEELNRGPAGSAFGRGNVGDFRQVRTFSSGHKTSSAQDHAQSHQSNYEKPQMVMGQHSNGNSHGEEYFRAPMGIHKEGFSSLKNPTEPTIIRQPIRNPYSAAPFVQMPPMSQIPMVRAPLLEPNELVESIDQANISEFSTSHILDIKREIQNVENLMRNGKLDEASAKLSNAIKSLEKLNATGTCDQCEDLIRKIARIIEHSQENVLNKVVHSDGSGHSDIMNKLNKLISHDKFHNSEYEIDDPTGILAKKEPKESAGPTKESKMDINPLRSWASKHDIYFSKLNINYSTDSESLHATARKSISAKESIISIPREMLIYPTHPNVKGICNKVKKLADLPTGYEKICLALFLIDSTRKENDFSQYARFVLFSQSYKHFPFFYSSEQMRLLEGSYFKTLLESKAEQFRAEFTLIKNANIIEDFDEPLYVKARLAVMSKNYQVTNFKGSLNDGKTTLLAPMADVISNDPNNENAGFVYRNEKFEITAKSKIDANSEVNLFYGNMNNYHYLLYYGTTLRNNPNRIEIYLDHKQKDMTVSDLLLNSNVDLGQTLQKIRQVVANNRTAEDSGSESKSGAERLDYKLSVNSLETEIRSIALLKRILNGQIKKYKTTIKEDKKYSSTKNLDIIRVLVEEKRRVLKYYNMCVIFSQILSQARKNRRTKFKAGSEDSLLLKANVANVIRTRRYYRRYFSEINRKFKLGMKLPPKEKGGDDDPEDLENEQDSEDDIPHEPPVSEVPPVQGFNAIRQGHMIGHGNMIGNHLGFNVGGFLGNAHPGLPIERSITSMHINEHPWSKATDEGKAGHDSRSHHANASHRRQSSEDETDSELEEADEVDDLDERRKKHRRRLE